MLPKLLAGVLLIVIFAAVSTFCAVYFMDYSGAATESDSCSSQAPLPMVGSDDPPCCDVSCDKSASGVTPARPAK